MSMSDLMTDEPAMGQHILNMFEHEIGSLMWNDDI